MTKEKEMTIKELYELAVKRGYENAKIYIGSAYYYVSEKNLFFSTDDNCISFYSRN